MGTKSEHSFLIATLSIVVFLSILIIYSENVYGKTPVETITPTKLNATAISPTQVTLVWLPPTQNYGKTIVGYKIEQMVGGGVFDTLVTNTDSTFPTYSVTGLKTGSTFTFRVSAVYSDDSTTDPSNWAAATPTVTSMSTSNISSSSSQVNEKFDLTPADGTTIYGVVLTQIDYQQLQYKKEPRSIISNNVQTAEPINNDYNGIIAYQNSHKISPTVPAPLIATAASPTTISLSWLPPEETFGQVIIGYKIEWKQASGVYVPVEDNTNNLDTKYSIAGLRMGTTYTYRVSAIFASETISNPSNEASATPLALAQSVPNNPIPVQASNNTTSTSNVPTPTPLPTQTINVEFDFTPVDGTTLSGVILTQNEYQQLIVIKDPRSIISNVTQTTNTINNDLSGILRYQSLHIPPTQKEKAPNYTQPSPTPSTGLDIRVLESVITSVIASGAVGIITWLVRTKIAKKIAKEYHFTIEKFVDDMVTHIRIRNSGQTIEDCTVLCDKEVCFWTDTNLDKPRHILEGSISVARLPTGFEKNNPMMTVKSGKKILRRIALDDMAHG